MRKVLLGLVGVVAFAGIAAAQTTIDDFESYAATSNMTAKWSTVTGFSVPALIATGGANGTSKYMEIQDAGYSKGMAAPNLMSPPAAGSYKVTFYYENGQSGNPWPGLELKVTQNGTVIANKVLGSTAQATWLAAETPVVTMDTSPLTISIVGTSTAQANNYCGIDEIKLVAAAQPLSVTATPSASVRLFGTQTVTAAPAGGVAPYTVRFDVGNDGTNDGTASSSPYTFSWNTIGAMAAGTSGTVALKVTVTDSASATASYTGTYTIDNRGTGLTQMVSNGDFSGAFTGTAPQQVPTSWVDFLTTDSYTAWGPAATADQLAGHGAALSITVGTALPSVETTSNERYKIRSAAKLGKYTDLQTTFWGKGGFARLYYFTSPDGATWTKYATAAAIADDANWTFAIGPIIHTTLGSSATSQISVATHSYLVGTYVWDDVSFTALDVTGSGVNDWRLY